MNTTQEYTVTVTAETYTEALAIICAIAAARREYAATGRLPDDEEVRARAALDGLHDTDEDCPQCGQLKRPSARLCLACLTAEVTGEPR